MKRYKLYLGIATALVASCSTQEKDIQTPVQEDAVFYATFERPAEEGTRVYANDNLLLRWTANDRVSIFNKITYNREYKFLGETGDNAGGFNKVNNTESVTGNPISHVVSVYPYQAATSITEEEVVSLTLPAEQHYAENTFGLGANTMVSVSEDYILQYKNVGGFLMLKLYGEDVSVSSITLKGNNGENLAGKATVSMPLDGTPTVTLAEDAVDQITLICDTPVALGATAEESTPFWFVVPPVTFSKGFIITIIATKGDCEKSTEKTMTIDRNNLSKMAPIEVDLSSLQARNVIYYKSSDGAVVTPHSDYVFGAKIVSNEYVDGLGVITFDREVTSIGDSAFDGCASLTRISIPEGVTSIGVAAFQFCIGLTHFTIPTSVTSIGVSAFNGCSSLMSFRGKYSTPDGLFLIDSGTLIAAACGAMNGEVMIPENVTSIGKSAFSECRSLANITIPDSVTGIESSTFYNCRSLTDITIPNGVTSIESIAFYNCSSLTSITIPDGVSSIGDGAFRNCSSLIDIIVKPKAPPTGGVRMFLETNNAPIKVPDESVEAYRSARYWSDYAYRIQAISSFPVSVPEAVDLGLPSGVKWALCNLGASEPEEYGDYYAWGEMEAKDDYSFATYKWCMGDWNTMIKYCNKSECGYNGFTDTKTVLDLEDDAANMNLGNCWRMPTDAEWTELMQNCTWEWTTQNGVNGRLVTASNGNSIFLPAAGTRQNAKLVNVGSRGRYWSSSLYTDYPNYAFSVSFNSDASSRIFNDRCYGYSIRPVYAE